MEVVASLSQGRTAAAQCGFFKYKSVPVIFEPPCIFRKPRWLSRYNKEVNFWKIEDFGPVPSKSTKFSLSQKVQSGSG